MDKILENSFNRHTFFQLNFFVLAKEPTHQAKLKRCVDEIKVRKKSIDMMNLEIDDLKDKNELIQQKINSTSNEIEKRILKRKIFVSDKNIEELFNKIKSENEEIQFFIKAYDKLNSIESIKPWDDINVQLEYWNAKYSEELKYRLLCGLPIDMELIKSIMAMPDTEIKKKVISMFKEKQLISEQKNG